MNNKLLKKIIYFFIILVIIIFMAIIVIKGYIKNNKYENELGTGSDALAGYGKDVNGGIDEQSYFDVKTYMQKYIDTINMSNTEYGYYDKEKNYIKKLEENEIKQKIYNLLSNKYISKKNINLENLYEYIDVLQERSIFVPIEISLIQDSNVKSFLVYGIIEAENDYSVIDKIFAIVNIDFSEYRFSIELIDGEYASISEIKIEEFEKSIIANEDNEFDKAYVETEDYPAEYIKLYKGLAFGAPEKLYNLLDEQYRNVKFGNLDEFKRYIKENKTEILTARLDKYKVELIDDERRYICIDQNENYYIIHQKEFLDYTMMLDTYTIDIEEFIEKYDNSSDKIKVALNIEKLIDATENEDYKYVYSKLDEKFKTNNFKTLQDFEKFIKEKFDPKEDTIKYKEYEDITKLHVYNITVTDASENKEIEAKVVMDLKKGRDFVFSFSVQ